MLKVIVVADEAITRIGISYSVFWEKCGYTIVGNASNQEEMVTLIKSDQPDFIFAEFKCNNNEEIEVIHNIKVNSPQSEIIAFGSNHDLSYIKKLLNLGVFDYIDKKSFEPNLLIKKLTYYKEVLAKKNTEFLKDNKEINNSILFAAQSQILKELLFGRRSGEELNQSILKLYGIMFPHHNFVVLMTKFPDNEELYNKPDTQHYFQSIVERGTVLYTCDSSLNEMCFIYNFREDSQDEHEDIVKEIAEKILHNIKKHFGVNTNIFISSLHKDIEDISVAYLQCCRAMKMNRGISSHPLIYFDEKEKKRHLNQNISLGKYVNELAYALKELDEVKVKYVFSSMINEIHEMNYIELGQLKYTLSVIVYVMNHYTERAGNQREESLIDAKDTYNYLEQLESKHDCITFIQHLGHQLLVMMNNNSGSNFYIRKMKDYVKNHYFQKVDMKVVANDMGLTTSYMSTLFKKCTGQTYKEYLIHYRLEKGKELLLKTTMHVAEISQLVGYDNEHYFSKIFKKKMGVTPTEYRNHN